jgi:hypothetical protein
MFANRYFDDVDLPTDFPASIVVSCTLPGDHQKTVKVQSTDTAVVIVFFYVYNFDCFIIIISLVVDVERFIVWQA